jgi:hypothetical protein
VLRESLIRPVVWSLHLMIALMSRVMRILTVVTATVRRVTGCVLYRGEWFAKYCSAPKCAFKIYLYHINGKPKKK